MKVGWEKVKIGDVVWCDFLSGPSTVYHTDGRGVFVCSKQAAALGHGHGGSSAGVKSPIGGQCGHWNFWKDEYPVLFVVRQANRFRGNR